MTIRLLIADDDPIAREGLKMILQFDEQFQIMGCVENGLQAVEYCLNHPVDLALLDVRMPVLNGVEAAAAIAAKTGTKALILTTFDEDEYIVAAFKSGAKGYLLKNTPPEQIKDVIRMVYGGHTVMQDIVMDKLKEGIGVAKKTAIDNSLFSEREWEIVKLIAEGLSNRGIARKLYITEGTVANYITSIFNKTGLEHRTQIAIYYLNGSRG